MEERLRHIWAHVLAVDTSSVRNDSDFFGLGGDSVKCITLAGKANDAGLQLFPQTIFDHPVFSDMAERTRIKVAEDCEGESSRGDRNQLSIMQSWDIINTCLTQCDISNNDLEDICLTAPFQQELIRAAHESGVWMFQAVFQIFGERSLSRAKEAIELIRKRNPALRTRIVQYDNAMYQVVTKAKPVWKTFTGDLLAYKEMDLQKRTHYGDPLDRLCIVEDSSKLFIVWTKVHAIYDRWSKMEFMVDLRQAFEKPVALADAPARPAFRSFIDFLSGQDQKAGLKYWSERLVGLEEWAHLWPDTLNLTMEREYVTSRVEWQRKTINFRKPTTRLGLDTLAQAAWALTLANVSQSSDVFFMQLRSCRQMSLSGIERIIGPLWSPCPIRRKLSAKQTLQDYLTEIFSETNAGIQHEPFGLPAALQHFGHRRFLQSALMVQPPQPDTFSADIVANDDNGEYISMRSAEDLWTQARGSFGFYIVLTPKKDDKLEIWTRFDDRFIEGNRVSEFVDKFCGIFDDIISRDWERTRVEELCPHLTEGTIPKPQCAGNARVLSVLTDIFRSGSKDATALIIPREPVLELSHGDLKRVIDRMQSQLAEHGIARASAVSIALPNSLELIVAFLATTWQRAVAAPLNPAYKQSEFEFYINDLGSALVIIPKGAYGEGHEAVHAARNYGAAIAECYWDDDHVALDIKESGKLAKAKGEKKLEAEEEDVALVLHTSGTTGRPKAVPLTHANLTASIGSVIPFQAGIEECRPLISSADNICRTYNLTAADRTMLIMPLFHVHGLLASFLSPLHSGGSAIVPHALTPEFWSIVRQYKATWFSATPSMHRVILEFPPPASDALKRVRFIRSCSSQLSAAMFKRLEETFSIPILESYAMTEASHLMCSNPLPPGKRFAGSVGQPQGLELKILDDGGECVPQGKEGEVCVRGKSVTRGYLNNPEANKTAFTSDGFFRTGDQGKLDENGYLTLTGRLKELINKGGEKISPAELDNLLSQHESLSEAVSFAIDDEGYGQDIGVAVKLVDGATMDAQELKSWVGKRVSTFKVPKKVWFPDEIPKTATGKVQRRLVAEAMVKG